MAKGFRHGASGGGTELTFRVLDGLTQPAAPREKDIWVACEGMTGWVFAADRPEEAAEGLVWLTVGTESSVAFNALKKNGLTVCPVSASQFVGGAWVSKTAQSRQDGAWVSWWLPGTLFADGIDATELTGGWDSFAYSAGSGIDGRKITAEILPDGIFAPFPNARLKSTFIGTGKRVDVSGYTTLSMVFSEATRSTASGAVKACLYSDAGYTVAAEAAVLSTSGETNLAPEIDVSGLDGAYYIGFFMWAWDTCDLSAKMASAKLR